jgi:hypothetical protein
MVHIEPDLQHTTPWLNSNVNHPILVLHRVEFELILPHPPENLTTEKQNLTLFRFYFHHYSNRSTWNFSYETPRNYGFSNPMDLLREIVNSVLICWMVGIRANPNRIPDPKFTHPNTSTSSSGTRRIS